MRLELIEDAYNCWHLLEDVIRGSQVPEGINAETKETLRCVFLLAAFGLQSGITSQWADACTRVTYLDPDDNVITARSMDWAVDVGTDLWIFPRGMQRNARQAPHSLEWTSQYGSVIATGSTSRQQTG